MRQRLHFRDCSSEITANGWIHEEHVCYNYEDQRVLLVELLSNEREPGILSGHSLRRATLRNVWYRFSGRDFPRNRCTVQHKCLTPIRTGNVTP
jgi:hypothetical protein